MNFELIFLTSMYKLNRHLFQVKMIIKLVLNDENNKYWISSLKIRFCLNLPKSTRTGQQSISTKLLAIAQRIRLVAEFPSSFKKWSCKFIIPVNVGTVIRVDGIFFPNTFPLKNKYK